MQPSTNPIEMLNPENNDTYSLSDVLQVLNIKTYGYDYTDRLQALQHIKQAYHANLKHQPELAPIHESTLINQLHDLQMKYSSKASIDYNRVNYLSDLAHHHKGNEFVLRYILTNSLMPSVTARMLNLPKWKHSEQNPANSIQ